MLNILRNQLSNRFCAPLIAILGVLASSSAGATTPGSPFDEVGRLYVQNFAPEDYDAHAQNWAVVQAPNGFLYVGNGEGVLEYDGVSWRLIPVSNQSAVRSLAINREGQVFVGASRELGYLAPDSQGRTQYVSLLDHIPAADRDFDDVWRIEETSEGLYFRTRQRLLRWNGRDIKVWQIETRLSEIFALDDVLYAQLADLGLMRMVEDTLTMTPGGDLLQSRFYGVVPQGDTTYLAVTRRGMLRCATRSLAEEGCTLVNPELTGLLDTLRAFHATELPDGKLAIGTIRGGVIVLDETGKLLRILNEESGLRDGRVKATYVDRQGGLWLALNNGLARVETGAPVSYYDKTMGLLGAVSAIVRHRDRLYATSDQGVSRLEPTLDEGAEPRFVPLAGFNRQCWSLLSTPQGLLAGCSNGIHDVDDQQRIGDLGALEVWEVVRSNQDPMLIYLGLSRGVARMRLHDGQWIDDGRLAGVRETVRSIVEDGQGRLWLGTRSEGVVLFDPARGPSEEGSVRRYGTAEGLPSGRIEVQHMAGRVAFVSRAGLFRLADADRFVPDTTFDAFLPRQMKRQFRFQDDTHDRVWVVVSEASAIAQFQPNGSHTWAPSTLRRAPMRDVYSTYLESDGSLWVGGPHGLTRLDTNRPFDPSTPYPVAIRDVVTAAGSLLFDNRHTPDDEVEDPVAGELTNELSYRENALRFAFAAPRYAAPGRTHYRTRLDGFDHKWSAWSTETEKSYTNLWEGRYVFRVEARDVYGVVSREDTFLFRILPPWYRTWWAYSLYGMVLAAAVLAYVRSHRQELRRERQISERERAANLRLREADRLKDEFLANTSHELRTPLYGITGLAESLIDGAAGEVSEAMKKNLSMIVASGQRLGQLVNDVLDYSRLTHKSLELRQRPVDLRPLVDAVLTLQQPLVGGKGLKLINGVPRDLPTVDADEARLEQILHNLVGNAIKFTEEGSVEVSAAIEEVERPSEGEQATRQILVTVEDTGIGIDENQQQRIFEAFEQADSGNQRVFGGTGLGLTISRKLVELHGGRIWVESTVGEGALFSFTLPISDPAATAASPAEQPISRMIALEATKLRLQSDEGEATPSLVGGLPPSGPPAARILVVDDEPVNLQVLSNHLASEGYEVESVSSGAGALSCMEERAFDLVMLDVMMPRMSGYEVCRKLRERHSLEELPVIFLTARNQVPDLVKGLEAGGNDYLAKPIAKAELLARVRTHLELLSVHHQLADLVDERTSELQERERLLVERERLIGQLESRNAELARFNYTVSHDLKNPLTTIRNFIGVLEQDLAVGDHGRLHDDLQRIDNAASKLHRLLEDLHELSQVEQATIHSEPVALGELVDHVLEELAPVVAARGIAVEVAEDLPAVSGDRARLLVAVRHLLANAFQYLGDQPAPRVEVGARQLDPETVVFVRDNGLGIDATFHEKIFGLFDRLEPEASDGTGIGLALARRIIEIHSGQIWVESEGNGHGSTFCFTLPASGLEADGLRTD